MIWLFNFVRKNNFLSFFRRSGLKFIFHCKAQFLILSKTLFNSFADLFLLSTTEKREVSSAKSLGFGSLQLSLVYFLIHQFSLVLISHVDARLCQTLLICQGKHLLLPTHHQRIYRSQG